MHLVAWGGQVCTSSTCDSQALRTIERMTQAIRGVLAARRPTLPVLSKWTKVGPCVDWYLLYVCCRGSTEHLFPAAFSAFQASHRPSEAEGVCDAFAIWQKLSGERVKKVVAGAKDRSYGASFVTLALAMEPVRHLTYFFLKVLQKGPDTSKHSAIPLPSPPARPPAHPLFWPRVCGTKEVGEVSPLCPWICCAP